MPKAKKSIKGLHWMKVDSGAHVLVADDIPLWDIYPAGAAWIAAPYVGGESSAHKAGPFDTVAKAKAWVMENSIPWLCDLLTKALKDLP